MSDTDTNTVVDEVAEIDRRKGHIVPHNYTVVEGMVLTYCRLWRPVTGLKPWTGIKPNHCSLCVLEHDAGFDWNGIFRCQ